jgi:hypothetical protein
MLDIARNHLQKNQFQAATELLYQISKENENYSESSELLIKHYFKTKNYEKLFANAMFYRHWLKTNPQVINYRPKVFAIEALALSMNCRTEQAELILQESQTYADKFKIEKNYIARTRQQLKIGQSFPEFILNNQVATNNTNIDKKDLRQVWKIETSAFDRLPNAKGLSIKLEDKCKK